MNKKPDKSIRVSDAMYQRIKRIAKTQRRSIKTVVELAFDYMEGLVK